MIAINQIRFTSQTSSNWQSNSTCFIRFDGLVEEEFLNFDWSDVTTVDDWESFCIPKHRVYYFKQHGEVVWDRKTRTDKIFTDKEINCDQCDKT